MRTGFWRLFGRSKTPPVLDPVGYRLPSYLVPSDETPWGPSEDQPSAGAPGIQDLPRVHPPAPLGVPQVRLMMADGSVQDLPEDAETARKAAYYARSMLSPPPPPPPPGAS